MFKLVGLLAGVVSPFLTFPRQGKGPDTLSLGGGELERGSRPGRKAITTIVLALVMAGTTASAVVACSSPEPPPPTPTPNPNMSRIAFVSDREGNWDIYLMNADGSDLRNLTNNPGLDGHPSWSPDGSRLMFYSDRDGDRDIYVMDVDGSNVVQLTNDPGADHSPAWSPDGTRVAFISDREGRTNLWLMNADGSDSVNLSPRAVNARWPDWSPDSSLIAVVSNKDLLYVDPDASIWTRTITANDFALEAFFLGWPDWSPNGERLALVSNFRDRDRLMVGSVYTADSEDGFNFRPVYFDSRGVEDPDIERPVDDPVEFDERPTWSPDGKKIAYGSFTEDGDMDIWVVDFETKIFTRLTDYPAMDSFPAWEPTGAVPVYPASSSTSTPPQAPRP